MHRKQFRRSNFGLAMGNVETQELVEERGEPAPHWQSTNPSPPARFTGPTKHSELMALIDTLQQLNQIVLMDPKDSSKPTQPDHPVWPVEPVQSMAPPAPREPSSQLEPEMDSTADLRVSIRTMTRALRRVEIAVTQMEQRQLNIYDALGALQQNIEQSLDQALERLEQRLTHRLESILNRRTQMQLGDTLSARIEVLISLLNRPMESDRVAGTVTRPKSLSRCSLQSCSLCNPGAIAAMSVLPHPRRLSRNQASTARNATEDLARNGCPESTPVYPSERSCVLGQPPAGPKLSASTAPRSSITRSPLADKNLDTAPPPVAGSNLVTDTEPPPPAPLNAALGHFIEGSAPTTTSIADLQSLLEQPTITSIATHSTSSNSSGTTIMAAIDAIKRCTGSINGYVGVSNGADAVNTGVPLEKGLGPEVVEAMLSAAEKGDVDQMEQLLAAGISANTADARGNTALHCAAGDGRHKVVQLLLDAGAEIEAKNKFGVSPLHMAALCDLSGRGTSVLLAAGARIDSRDGYGWTPLHSAAATENACALRYLLEAGADPLATDDRGRLAVDLAYSVSTRELLKA